MLPGTNMNNCGTNLAKRTGELEMPTTRSRDALDGHRRTLTHPGHYETPNDSPPWLALTVLAVITRQPQNLLQLVRFDDWVVARIAISATLDKRFRGFRFRNCGQGRGQ